MQWAGCVGEDGMLESPLALFLWKIKDMWWWGRDETCRSERPHPNLVRHVQEFTQSLKSQKNTSRFVSQEVQSGTNVGGRLQGFQLEQTPAEAGKRVRVP